MAGLPFPVTALTSSSSALLLATGSALHFLPTGSTSLATTPSTLDAKVAAAGLVRRVALSDDGSLAVSCHDDKVLRVWDVDAAQGELKPRSARTMFKRAASASFTAKNEIVMTDKVGDVYLYPLDPREAAPLPQGFKVQADPSLNPDADFLLGHVSVVSQHVLAPDGKHILTADRDEHIRVSRFPKAYVIERYLFGSEGFVSAIHIPRTHPTLLLSAGGEPTMQLWDWAAGSLLSRIPIFPAVLPHRRVRPPPRRLRSKQKAVAADSPTPSDDPTDPGFYVAPAGNMYPTGAGVCVERIDTVVVGESTVVVFFAEGCTAVHAFVLPTGGAGEPTVHSQAFAYPVLGFTAVPGSAQLLVALDSSYGIGKADAAVDPARAAHALAVVEVAADGSLTDVSAASPIVAPLTAAFAEHPVPPAVLASLSLYPDLTLFPRWPGFEEDEELAGPAAAQEQGQSGSQFENMNGKQLGRLKAQGAAVPQDLLSKKHKKRKNNKGDKVETGEAPAAEGEVPAAEATASDA